MLSKKGGDEKYYIIISLIIGLIVVGIVLWFLFHEYFTSEDISWETCRQSIILRSNMPQKGLLSAKDFFPLRCKTDVVDINYEDKLKAEKDFANSLVSCWYLMGNGGYKVFPAELKEYRTNCIICSRIHIDSKVRDYYSKNIIDIGESMLMKTTGGKNYWEYLRKINPNANPWKLVIGVKDVFDVKASDEDILWSTLFEILFSSPVYPVVAEYFNYGNAPGESPKGIGVYLPHYFKPENGDMFVVISSPASSDSKATPALFFFQSKQMDSAITDLSSSAWSLLPKTPLCGSIESIPA